MEITAHIPFRHHRVMTDDRVSLAVQVVGRGPALVMANGIGITYQSMTRLVERFLHDFTIVMWDYRGFGASLVGPEVKDFSMERQARDLLCVMDFLGLEEAALLGWSMGVPVILETTLAAASRVRGLISLFGAGGSPLSAGWMSVIEPVFRPAVRWMLRYPFPVQKALDLSVAAPGPAFKLLQLVNFVGRDADKSIFFANIRGERDSDKRVLGSTLLELADHSMGGEELGGIRCPTLVVAGTRDILTPPKLSRDLAAGIPGAQLEVFPGMTHFGLIEGEPALLDLLDSFLSKQLVADISVGAGA